MSPTRPSPRCSVFIAVSVDGCIARDDGSVDWLDSVAVPGEDYGYAAFVADVDAFVMGRATYDTCVGFPTWPFEGKRVIVMTHRQLEPLHGETAFAGTPGELLARLADEGVRHVYVDGGRVIQQFLADGCVDAITLSVIPCVLGSGRRLFGPGTERAFALASVRSWPSGLVQLRYVTRA